MQKLLALFTQVLAFLANLKSHAVQLQTDLDAANALVTDMKGKLDAEQLSHAALIARATTAEAHASDLDDKAAQLDIQANELANAINDHPDAPNVNPVTLAPVPPFVETPVPPVPVTEPTPSDAIPTNPLAPASSAPSEFPNGAPSVPPPVVEPDHVPSPA